MNGYNKYFASTLEAWYHANKRSLPWRKTKDPYLIWLSEIILQQTRVEQGLPYWKRFVSKFPTVETLAKAEEDDVMRLWQGLGYYSRARNLHATAKIIYNSYNSVFPDTYDKIIQLKGIGQYTAAAILSFCYGIHIPVVDGNVFRFASRMFGITEDISASKAHKVFSSFLTPFIKHSNPDIFNQAMMEFGATVCSPSPHCGDCVFINHCFAYQKDLTQLLPIKSKKIKIRKRSYHYFVFSDGKKLLMKKREGGDVWQGLYDFFLIEGDFSTNEVLQKLQEQVKEKTFEIAHESEIFTHVLTHQKIKAKFYLISVPSHLIKVVKKNTDLKGFSKKEVFNLPKSKLIISYFDKYDPFKKL